MNANVSIFLNIHFWCSILKIKSSISGVHQLNKQHDQKRKTKSTLKAVNNDCYFYISPE